MGLNSSGRKRKTERSVGASEEALAVSVPQAKRVRPPLTTKPRPNGRPRSEAAVSGKAGGATPLIATSNLCWGCRRH